MIRKILIISSFFFVLGACTKDYDTINVDPNSPAEVPLDFILAQTQLQIAGISAKGRPTCWKI